MKIWNFLKNNLSGRIGRAHLVGGVLFYSAGYLVTSLVIAYSNLLIKGPGVSFPFIMLFGVTVFAFLWVLFGLLARRLHDIGYPAGALVLWIIPVLGFFLVLYFLAKKGNSSINEYGEPNPVNIKFFEDIFNKKYN